MEKQYSFSDKKILIVDGQRSYQTLLKTMLENFGATHIFSANSGESALHACQKQFFDIFLVTYSLGNGKNGAQLLEELRENNCIDPASLYFIISGDNNREIVLNALETEPDDFLTKPFSQKQLKTRITKAYQKRQELLPVYIALAEKQYERAIEACKEYLHQSSRCQILCHSLIIESYIQLKDYKNAREHLLEFASTLQQSWCQTTLGRIEYLLGNYAHAIEMLQVVINNHPLVLNAYVTLALSYRDSGQLKHALDIIQKANDLSPLSLNRQQITAELALESHHYALTRNTFGKILQLTRQSFHKSPGHLCNFIRSLIDEAHNESDLYRKNRLLQEVNAVLFKARLEEGAIQDFDFDAFEGLSQARIFIVKGERLQAKRVLFSTNEQYLEAPTQVSNALLPDTYLTLHNIGEYEYAFIFAEELKKRDQIDRFALKAVHDIAENPEHQSTLENIRHLNQLGIIAYGCQDYIKARQYFKKALKLTPGNIELTLNKIQAIIRNLESKDKLPPNELEECKLDIRSISGLKLNKTNTLRLKSLSSEFQALFRQNES
ncbi:MAG: hypothetical protein CENE_00384 [Candidatus Celerinatantimonas neptuna]|nr:MAG: hypothetical protein CENE_00384 [Candidatus Celerinatantimonas neptuna]